MIMGQTEIRETGTWKMFFHLMTNERYAQFLLRALASLGTSLKMTVFESNALHSGYDHMLLFSATGYAIKGEDTEGTKLVCDVLYKYKTLVTPHLDLEINTLLDSVQE